jgi:hypothetical protein
LLLRRRVALLHLLGQMPRDRPQADVMDRRPPSEVVEGPAHALRRQLERPSERLRDGAERLVERGARAHAPGGARPAERRLLRSRVLTAVVLGAAVAPGIVLDYVAAHGALHDFFESVVLANAAYLERAKGGVPATQM